MATHLGQAAAVSLEARAAIDPGARHRFFVTKWVRSVFLSVAGALATAACVAMYLDTRADHTVARNVTAADLLRIDKPESLPDWISYNPPKAIDTGVAYVKMRSRKTVSKFLLLQVGDRWLVTEVPEHFKEVRVEGKLGPFDEVALKKVVTAYPNEAGRFLPFQLEAKLDIAGTQRRSYGYAGAVGVFGLLMFFTGVRGFFAKPPPYLGAVSEQPVRDTPRKPSYQFVGQALPEPTYQPAEPAHQSERPPRQRSLVVRAFFGFVWAGVFFVVAATIASLLATMGAGDDPEVRKQLAQEAGQKHGPLLVLGSIVLATGLGWLGWLPGTRR
jgi:hypothetical protein